MLQDNHVLVLKPQSNRSDLLHFSSLIRLSVLSILGDSSVLHCASCTAHNNRQQKIMAPFLAGKLVREKNGRFERHGCEKEVEICGKEGKDS